MSTCPRISLVLFIASLGCGSKIQRDTSNHETATALASSDCDGAPVVDPAALFSGKDVLAEVRPTDHSVVAIDGLPTPRLICTLVGCDCCNDCGYDPQCPYALAAGPQNEVCLKSSGFACGGKSCSTWCTPFSTQPQHRYRFVGELQYFGAPQSVPGARLAVTKICALP